MSAPNEMDGRMEAMLASLQDALPDRVVTRSLPADWANLPEADLLKGVVCLVCEGGGDFANYIGRNGELGEMGVSLAGFVKVAHDTEPVAIESAEFALLADLLAWCKAGAFDLVPESWAQSKQLEHPYGWIVLKTTVDS